MLDATKKLKPPANCSNETNELWKYLLDLDKKNVDELAGRLNTLPESNLFDCV